MKLSQIVRTGARLSLLAWVLVLLGACAQINHLLSYSIDEPELTELVREQLGQLQHKVTLAGIPVTLTVKDLAVQIGPDGSDAVRLGTSASAVFNAMGVRYPANIKLALEAAPVYDGEQQALYLHNLKILDSTIDAAGYRGNLAPLAGTLTKALNGVLAKEPVYRLNGDDATQSMLMGMPLSLSVEQGRIRFSPAF